MRSLNCQLPSTKWNGRSNCVAIVGLVALVASSAGAQSPPAFDVVSVKRFAAEPESAPGGSISILPGGRFSAPAATLRGLIAAAYGLLNIQVVDSQNLLGNERFEVEARTSPDVSVTTARAMLRRLLAERFGLAAHAETRQLPVYTMTLAGTDRRPGPQLRPSGPECALPKGPPGVPPPPPPPAGPPTLGRPLPITAIITSRCPLIAFRTTSGSHWSLREITMAGFAQRLIEPLGRPVLDQTGLTGAFDVDLTFLPDNPAVDAANAPNVPSLTSALREQLGLRLESTRAPVEVLVIDRIQPPTSN